jgi:hypothetical protein
MKRWKRSSHIPHPQKSTSAITCSCLQRVIAVFGHLRVIGAYFEKCSIDKSAVSTDYCVSQTGAPSESNRAFVVIEHSLLQVNHPQRSRQEENTQEPGKGCGMWAVALLVVIRNPLVVRRHKLRPALRSR